MEPKDEILSSFHKQFAENQNHHQRLFIQFIAAVFVVLVGYALVYVNTGKDAYFLDARRNDSGQVTQYAIVDLMGAYVAAQTILCSMIALVANIGYGYRRDQQVNYNIKQYYLGERLCRRTFTTFGDRKILLGFHAWFQPHFRHYGLGDSGYPFGIAMPPRKPCAALLLAVF